MATTRMPDSKGVELTVHADLVPGADAQQPPKMMAYAYSAGGHLQSSAPLDDKGYAALSVPIGEEDTALRLLVGPVVEPPDLAELLRRGATEQHLRISPKVPQQRADFQVYPDIWHCWIGTQCLVRGTLLKRMVIGGISVEHPVCHAHVDVWEVDSWPILVPRLPPDVIDWLRGVIIEPDPPFPIDPRVPGVIPLNPPPGPRPPQPGPGPDPIPMAMRSAMLPASAPATSMRAANADAAILQAAHVEAQGTDLLYAAQVGSELQFRESLLLYPDVIRPLLCYFYPTFITKQKIATALTDECGRFSTVFYRSCLNPDAADLYFTAYQHVFPWFDLTIYAPTPVACHTHWNYVCGTPVTLVTTSPWARTCLPCPPVIAGDNWVLFMAIGRDSLKKIFGGGAAPATATNLGLRSDGAPWGGMLRPRLEFDNALRQSLGVKYYQLSWRRGTTGDFAPLTRDVNRHYEYEVGGLPVLEPYKLGPNYMSVGGETLALYEIPPAVPPSPGVDWSPADPVLDTQNGEFDSVLFSEGLSFEDDGTPVAGTADESGHYQIKLDLYDAAGNQIDIAALGINYCVPSVEDLSGTVTTVNANTIAQPGGGNLVQGNSMILTLHVDNNRCWAGIGAPTTPSGAADPCCGVLKYGSGQSVTMPYVAHHPHGFADRSFVVTRSATTILSDSGGTGSFALTRTVADMMSINLPAACLSEPPCTTAAFAETLYVAAKATDGWSRLSNYDASDTRAFALTPLAPSV